MNIFTCNFSECRQDAEFICKCSASFWCRNHINIHGISSIKTMKAKILEFSTQNAFDCENILDQASSEPRDICKIRKFERNSFLMTLILKPEDETRIIRKMIQLDWNFQKNEFFIATFNKIANKLIGIHNFKRKISSLLTSDINNDIDNISRLLENQIISKLSLSNTEKERILFYCSISQEMKFLYDNYLKQYQDIHKVLKEYIDGLRYDKNYLYNIEVINNYTGIWTFNLESCQKEWKLFSMPDNMGHQTCIVQLPYSQLFCFSSYSSNSGCAYIFNLKIGDLQRALPHTTPRTHSGGIYYSNAVYVFGGKINYSAQECCIVQKFDLNKNKWFSLPSLLKPSHGCSCAIFKNGILLSGDSDTRLYKYDLSIEGCSKIYSIKAIRHHSKILFTRNSRLYFLQQNGPIFESEIDNEYICHKIGYSNMTYSYNTSKIFIEDIVYFSIFYDQDVCCYKFDLSNKKVEKFIKNKKNSSSAKKALQ